MKGSNIDNGGARADGPPQGFALACVSRRVEVKESKQSVASLFG